jgi:hypothetical protein
MRPAIIESVDMIREIVNVPQVVITLLEEMLSVI